MNALVDQDSYSTYVEQDAAEPASLSSSELRIDFGAHLEANYQRLVAQMYAITLSPDQAHSAVQDAYSRAWRNWAVIGRSSDPTAWVRRVAVRTSMRSWRNVLARWGLASPTPRVADGLDARTTALLTSLHELPAPERRSLVLYHMAGLSQGEIAAVERVSAAAIHSRLARARQVVSGDTSDMLTGVIELPGGLLDEDRGYVDEMTLAGDVPSDQVAGQPWVGDGAGADIDQSWSAYGQWDAPDDGATGLAAFDAGQAGGVEVWRDVDDESPLQAGAEGSPADGGDSSTIDGDQAPVGDDMSVGDGEDVSQIDGREAAPDREDEVSQNDTATPRDDGTPRDDSEDER